MSFDSSPHHLTLNKNRTYLIRPKDTLGVFWTFYVRWIYVLFPRGWNSRFQEQWKLECFAKIVNGLKRLRFFAKHFISDVWFLIHLWEWLLLSFELTLRVNAKVTDAQHWFHDGRHYADNKISAKTLKLTNLENNLLLDWTKVHLK